MQTRHHALYKSRRWRGTEKSKGRDGLRFQALVRDNFTCRMCGHTEHNTSRLVADHIKPHKGDADLFFDIDNLQTLCKSPCHDKVKQKQERTNRPWQTDKDGWFAGFGHG